MSDEPTTTVTLELTEQQYDDALSGLNAREIQLRERGFDERQSALTDVWVQLFNGGRETFREGDAADADDEDEEVGADA